MHDTEGRPISMWKLSKLRGECESNCFGSKSPCSFHFLEVQKSTFNICKDPLKPFSSALGPLTFELTMQSSRRWALLHPSLCSHLLNPTTLTPTLSRSSKWVGICALIWGFFPTSLVLWKFSQYLVAVLQNVQNLLPKAYQMAWICAEGSHLHFRSNNMTSMNTAAKRERGGDCVVGKASLKFSAIKCSHCR